MQAVKTNSANKTVLLLQRLQADISKLVGKENVKLCKMIEPVLNSYSVDVFMKNALWPEGMWYSLFFTVSLPPKEGYKENIALSGMFLQLNYKYTVAAIELVLPEEAKSAAQKSLNDSFRTLVKQNMNAYKNF